MSMGLDLDCCVPYPAPSPKKFTVFRGSGNLESLGKLRYGGSRNVLPRTGKYQQLDFPSVLTMPPLAWLVI